MNNKKKTLILIGLFVLLMAGASILYNNLSANFELDSLVVENNSTEDNYDSVSNKINSDTDSSNTVANSSNSDSTSSDPITDEVNSSETSPQNSEQSAESSSENKNQAPNFTVYDLDGNEVNLTDFFGKPIIINFWASWCGPCKMEMPDFNEAYTNYKDEIEFLMVNMTDGSRETVEKASSFITESGYIFPVYYDTEYSAAITYSVTSLPTTYFINTEGEAVAHARGAIDAKTLQKGIDMIYFK